MKAIKIQIEIYREGEDITLTDLKNSDRGFLLKIAEFAKSLLPKTEASVDAMGVER